MDKTVRLSIFSVQFLEKGRLTVLGIRPSLANQKHGWVFFATGQRVIFLQIDAD